MTFTLMIVFMPYVGVQQSFYQSNLDLDPKTLIFKLDLDMVKIYHHTKNKVSMVKNLEDIARPDRHTDSTKSLPSHIRGR